MGNPLKSDVSDESEDDVQDVDLPARNKVIFDPKNLIFTLY